MPGITQDFPTDGGGEEARPHLTDWKAVQSRNNGLRPKSREHQDGEAPPPPPQSVPPSHPPLSELKKDELDDLLQGGYWNWRKTDRRAGDRGSGGKLINLADDGDYEDYTMAPYDLREAIIAVSKANSAVDDDRPSKKIRLPALDPKDRILERDRRSLPPYYLGSGETNKGATPNGTTPNGTKPGGSRDEETRERRPKFYSNPAFDTINDNGVQETEVSVRASPPGKHRAMKEPPIIPHQRPLERVEQSPCRAESFKSSEDPYAEPYEEESSPPPPPPPPNPCYRSQEGRTGGRLPHHPPVGGVPVLPVSPYEFFHQPSMMYPEVFKMHNEDCGSCDCGSSLPAKDDDSDDPDDRCGCFSFRPDCLQRSRSAKWLLFWLCWAGAIQGMIVNGFINSFITTIERRYSLQSTETGVIAGAYDIASFLTMVPVSYLGGAGSKPRWLGWGMIVMGLGSLLFALPQFTAGLYTFHQEAETVCYANATLTGNINSSLSNRCDSTRVDLSVYQYVFIVAQLLHGAGAAPLYTLGVAYLDESVKTKMSSMYIGIYYAMAIVGPAVGYLLGGQFLKLYTDFLHVDPAKIGLTPASSVWVGAWWVAFVLAGILSVLVAIPLLYFPKTLPGAKKLRKEKISEAHVNTEVVANQMGFGTRLKDLPVSFKILLKNPTFMFLNIGGVFESLVLGGLAAFLPKYIESQFSVASGYASLIVGIITVPAGGGGTFLGGYIIKRFNLKCTAIIRLCVLFCVSSFCASFLFVMSCPNISFAGINTPYDGSSSSSVLPNLIGDCSATCNCREQNYDPVCGTDNVMYYSPCFAGCQTSYRIGEKVVFADCNCISDPGYFSRTNVTDFYVQAVRDKCPGSCQLLPTFLVLTFFLVLFTFLITMPALSATLRCVADSQRSFALGIQWLIMRLGGAIPAPIVFGALMDQTCLLWQESCGEQGSCRAYNNFDMSRYILIITLLCKAIAAFFFILAWVTYRTPSDSNTSAPNGTIPPPIHGKINGGYFPSERPILPRIQSK